MGVQCRPALGSKARHQEIGASILPEGLSLLNTVALSGKCSVPFLLSSLPKRAERWGRQVGPAGAQTPSQADGDLPKPSIHQEGPCLSDHGSEATRYGCLILLASSPQYYFLFFHLYPPLNTRLHVTFWNTLYFLTLFENKILYDQIINVSSWCS